MAKVVRSHYGDGNSGDPVRWFRGKVARVEKGVLEALQDAMDDGALMMLENISTRGTAKSGKAGRIDTGKMHNDVDSSVTAFRPGKIQGKFGWIRNKETYYGLQEGGFDHVNGGTVEGMYALADAADWAMREFEKDMSKVVRNA